MKIVIPFLRVSTPQTPIEKRTARQIRNSASESALGRLSSTDRAVAQGTTSLADDRKEEIE